MTRTPPALAYDGSEEHPWVERYLEHCLGVDEAAQLVKTISASDEMFAYAIDANLHHRGHALVSYFRSGLLAYETTRAILAGSRHGDTATVLDFASGHGRMTRFLTRLLEPQNVSICEVGDDAPDFQEATFGVRSVEASLLPEGFDPGRAFDLVTAYSFFSHLPRPRFEKWLARLWSAVEPGGVLAFTTHGPSTLPPGRALAEDGFLFERHSESERLGVDDYGSAWVAPEVVSKMSENLPSLAHVDYLPRGVWTLQDLFMLSKSGGAAGSGMPRSEPRKELLKEPRKIALDLEPIGYVETSRPISPSSVELTGWAFDREAPTRPVALIVLVNGREIARVEPSGQRPDLVEAMRKFTVAEAEGGTNDRLGFAVTVDLARPVTSDDFVIVEAEASSGRRTVLHASALEGAALLRTAAEAEQRARNEAEQLRSRLYAMEQSHFWRLRNRWFAFKQLWGGGS